MKKLIFLLYVFFFIMGGFSSLQGQWTDQISGTSENLNGVCFPDTLNGWTCGENGKILHTTDGGKNWSGQSAGLPKNLYGIHFTDSNNGWAVGDNAFKLHTTDGGSLWQADSVGTTQHLKDVHFTDINNGWVVGEGHTVLHTTDGGSSWSHDTSGTNSGAPQNFYAVYFISADTGWIAGSNGKIFYTTNGGTSWTAQTSGTGNLLRAIHFVNSKNGWISGDGGTIIHTVNGGANWGVQTSGTGYNLHAVFCLDSTTCWSVSEGGTILCTTDTGATWTIKANMAGKALKDIFFADPYHAWVVGNAGFITHYKTIPQSIDITVSIHDTISTQDDTIDIPIMLSNVEQVENVYSFDYKIGFDTSKVKIVGFDTAGLLAGGFAIDSNFITADTFKISGSHTDTLKGSGILMKLKYYLKPVTKKIDTTLITPIGFTFNDKNPSVVHGRLVIKMRFGDVSLNGKITAIDASMVLQNCLGLVALGTRAMYAADVSGNGSVHAYDAALILRYLVNCFTLFPVETALGLSKKAPPNSCAFLTKLSENVEYIEYAITMKDTKDMYSSEISLRFSGLEYMTYEKTDITKRFIFENTTENGALQVALCGCEPINNEAEIMKLKFKKLSDNINVELNSVIVNEAEINVKELESLPSRYELSQNYPNPFNPETIINYQLPQKCNVQIIIYNILGQQIKTLVNTAMNAGYHSIKWNGKNNLGRSVSSGIYFYTIKTDAGFSKSKKMMILK